MKNKILLLIVLLLIAVYFSISSKDNTTFLNEKEVTINVKNNKTKEINNMELESYIVGVVASEMPASFHEEALKAQAIAARTYAVYKIEHSNKEYDVITSVANQGYITKDEMHKKWGEDFDKYYEKVSNAVFETKGKVLYYNDEVIESFYFAMSNGYTEEASLVFSVSKDYLQSVPSEYDKSLKSFQVTKTFNKQEFCNKLNISCENINIGSIERSNTGRVNKIKINGINYKGTDIRKRLGLRSTDFDINLNNDEVKITTKGYGHGVGMSQYGANGMAKDGFKYDEILNYYYKNIKISSI